MKTSLFQDRVRSALGGQPLTAGKPTVLQVNLGYRCNMACGHCHVAAGPGRNESMGPETVDAVIRVLSENPIDTLDITGGAPEMNPSFRSLVAGARKTGKRVIVRTNLTIFFEQGMKDLPEFYRDHGTDLIASLPCYLEDNVSAARGAGVFKKSIDALQKLNSLGIGNGSAGPSLGLVYNPSGPSLPPLQSVLEADYKRELATRYGISFTRLYVFANMPIGRFREALVRNGAYQSYADMLGSAFNPATLDRIMCRGLVSVGWDGRLFDCDFNQVLGMPVDPDVPGHVRDFDYEALSRRRISVDDHCFGCTAGQGST